MAYKRAASIEEKNAVLFLAELLVMADETADKLTRRLTLEQMQEIHAAAATIEKNVNVALDAMPDGTRQTIKRTSRNAAVQIKPRQMGKLSDGFTCIQDEKLDHLIREALKSSCNICMLSGNDIKRCKMREILRSISDVQRDSKYGMCGYAGYSIND